MMDSAPPGRCCTPAENVASNGVSITHGLAGGEYDARVRDESELDDALAVKGEGKIDEDEDEEPEPEEDAEAEE
jgi:hypothetical protein